MYLKRKDRNYHKMNSNTSSPIRTVGKGGRDAMDLTSGDLLHWLDSWPQVKSQLDMIVVGLRRRQLIGAHSCAKATLELLRTIVSLLIITDIYNYPIDFKLFFTIFLYYCYKLVLQRLVPVNSIQRII